MMDYSAVRRFLSDLESEHIEAEISALKSFLDGVARPSGGGGPVAKRTGSDREAQPPRPTIKRKQVAVPTKSKQPPMPAVSPPGRVAAGTRVIDRTLSALRYAGKPMSVADIAYAIGHRASNLQQCLASYVSKGLLVHTGRAHFGLPEHTRGNGKEASTAKPNGEFNPHHHVEKHRNGWICVRCDEVRQSMDDFESFFCAAGMD
jgi:hypothetical protein